MIDFERGLLPELLHLLLTDTTFRVLLLLQALVKLLKVLLLALELFILVRKLLDERLNIFLQIVDLLLLARGQVPLLDLSLTQLLLQLTDLGLLLVDFFDSFLLGLEHFVLKARHFSLQVQHFASHVVLRGSAD